MAGAPSAGPPPPRGPNPGRWAAARTLALTRSGGGALVLSSANSYDGLTTVSGGTLEISNGSALGTTAAGTAVSSGGRLDLSGGISVLGESLTLSGTAIFSSSSG